MPLLLTLAIIICAAKLLGSIATRFGQPAIFGELLTGILLGPTLLGVVTPAALPAGLSEIAVAFVVISAAAEMSLGDAARAFVGRALIVPVLSFVLPLASGLALGLAFSLPFVPSLALGVCLSVTALPVAIRILEVLGLMRSDLARYVISSAIINDLAAFLLIGALATAPTGSLGNHLALGAGKAMLFAGLISLAGWAASALRRRPPTAFHRMVENSSETSFALLLVMAFAGAGLCASLGLMSLVGVLFGALLFRELFGEGKAFSQVKNVMGIVSAALFSPIFFADVGLQFELSDTPGALFCFALFAVATLSKVFSGWLGGITMGVPPSRAWSLGLLLNARGVTGFLVSEMALQAGLVDKKTFSALIIVNFATTVITPSLVRRCLGNGKTQASHPEPVVE